MAALTWMLAKSLSTPAVAASLAAIGVTSGLLLVWMTHRSGAHCSISITRMQQQMATMAGKISAMRDESECRWTTQRIYAADHARARSIFGQPEEH